MTEERMQEVMQEVFPNLVECVRLFDIAINALRTNGVNHADHDAIKQSPEFRAAAELYMTLNDEEKQIFGWVIEDFKQKAVQS